jgi:hypothetical protein
MGVPFRSSPKFLCGREAELLVAAWCRDRGYYVIPSYDYSGPDGARAPMAQGSKDAIILPDLQIAAAGRSKWAEVKAKGSANYTITTGRYEHGIGYRKWGAYRRIQRQTGCFVYLFVVELDRQMVLAESLDVLGPGRVYRGPKMDLGGMIFWPRQKFRMRQLLQALPGLFRHKGGLPEL